MIQSQPLAFSNSIFKAMAMLYRHLNNVKIRTLCAILCAFLQLTLIANTTGAAELLFVVRDPSSLTSQDTARQTQFGAWGYTVTLIDDSDSQTNYDAALTTSDVVYITEEVASASVGYKLRETTVGVVCEEQGLLDEFGLATVSSDPGNHGTLTIIDNSHSITSSFSVGSVSFSSPDNDVDGLGGTLAPDLHILANWSSTPAVGVVDAGATLANTYNSSDLAMGRRVCIPVRSSFDWNDLTADGLTLFQRSIEWARGSEPLAHWKFDDTSGTVAIDSSGNGHDGSFNGAAAWSDDGIRSGAVDVDGSESVDVPAFSVGGSSLTLAAWVKPETLTNEGRLVMKSSSNLAADQSWGITVDDSGDLEFRVNAGGTLERLYAYGAIVEGHWHHIVGTYDGTTMRLYLDGKLVASQAHAVGGALSENSADIITIGNSPVGDREVDGLIDDVRVYSVAISDAEVAELFGLIGYWKFDETSGTVAADSSGRSNDGVYGSSTLLGQDGTRSYAAEFDDTTSSEVEVDLSLDEKPTEAQSIAAWIKADSFDGFDQIYNDRYTSGGGGVRFRLKSGRLTVSIQGLTTALLEDDEPLTLNRWTQVVVVYTGKEIRLYVDAKLVESIASTGLIEASPSKPLIGGVPGATQTFDGLIDDVQLYNRAMTEEEIIEHYGLIGHWNLDETSGTVAEDSSGLDHDGTIEAGTTIGNPAPRGNGYAFENSGEMVTVPQSNILDNAATEDNQEFAVAFWLKPNTSSRSGYRNVFYKGASPERGPTVYLPPSNNHLLFTIQTTTSPYWGYFSNAEAPQDRWTHVVVQAKGDTVSTYLNGTLDNQYSLSAPIVGSNGPLSFGNQGNNNTDCSMDDVRYYNRGLSESEIAELYQVDLIRHWRLDEISGTTATDSSVYATDGTYENGVTLAQDEPYPGYGETAEFGGVDGYVDVGTIDADFNSGMSIALWAKPEEANYWARFVDLGNGSPSDNIILARNKRTNTLSLELKDGSLGNTQISADNAIELDRWQHFVATVDSNGEAILYKDGKALATGTVGIPSGTARTQCYVGRSNWSVDDYYEGGLADVRIYQSALSAEEVSELYGLVGHWKLDEGTGTVAYDSTSFGNDGTLQSTATWSNDDNITAADLDGSTAYIDLGNPSHLNFEGPITLAAWVRSHAYEFGLGSGPANIVAHGHQTSPDREVVLRLQNGGYGISAWTPSEGTLYLPTSDDRNAWIHLVGMYDGTTWHLYRNGELKSNVAGINGARLVENVNWAIGAKGGGDDRHLDGDVRDVRIYNRAVNASEIAEMYGLVGWWRMEEVSGTHVADSSGMENHGTLSGSANWSADAKESFGALELDGTNAVEIPSLILSETSSGATIAGWAKLADPDSEGAELISLGNHFNLRLDQTEDSRGVNGILYTGSVWDKVASGRFVEDSGWHHFAASYDANTLEITLYIDGVKNSTTAASGNIALGLLGTNTTIGKHGDSDPNRDFTGLVDDVRVYNRKITPSEARALYYGEFTPGLRIIQWNEVAN